MFAPLAARTGPDGARSWADVTTQAVVRSMRATSGGFRRVNLDLGTVGRHAGAAIQRECFGDAPRASPGP